MSRLFWPIEYVLTVIIDQGHLIIAHQPAKVEYQHGPTSGKPEPNCLKFAYILRVIRDKVNFKPPLTAYFMTYRCKMTHQYRGIIS